METSMLNVRQFGARGDGQADDTAAIQKAIDAAAAIKGTAFVPDGTYLCSTLRMRDFTGLMAHPTFSYYQPGGAILKLADPKAGCLMDMSTSRGSTLNGLCLLGEGLGEGIHGLWFNADNPREREDAPRIERCMIHRFTGDGIHMGYIWCFNIRGVIVGMNKGHGLWLQGYDGFVIDSWFSGNGGAGICAAGRVNASNTITANRIEWNAGGGIRLLGGNQYNITGNYIDRSGGPAIALLGLPRKPSLCMTITGNVLYRSGRPEWTKDDLESSHVRLEECHGVVFSNNTMCVGTDDGSGFLSPNYGMVLRGLKNCVVKGNVMHIGALKQLVVDQGGHGEGVVIGDNVGNLFSGRTKMIWDSDEL